MNGWKLWSIYAVALDCLFMVCSCEHKRFCVIDMVFKFLRKPYAIYG